MAGGVDILFRAELDATGAITGLSRLEKETSRTAASASIWNKNIGGMAGNLIGAAAGFVSFGAVVKVAGDSLKRAIDVTESRNLFEVSMGRMKDAGQAWATDLRNQLGLNAEEVKKQLGVWQNMLTSMGLGTEQAFGMSKGLTQLANDMASFFNLPVEEAFQKLQSGISGEIEPLRRLGITVDEATVKTYAYTHGIAKQGEELTQQQKIMARYGVIMEQTKNAQGDLARTIESPANQLRMLGTRFDEVKVAMGDLMLSAGALGSPLTKLNGFLGGLAEVLNDTEMASSALKASLADMLLPINSLLGFNLGGFFNTAEAGWKDLTNWQDLTTKSLGNMVQKQQEAIAATAAQMRTTDKSSDAYKALQTQLMTQKARLGELKDVLAKKTKEDEANTKAVKAEEEAEKKRAAQLKDTSKEVQKAREEAEKHRRAMEDLVAEHTVLGGAQLEYSRGLAEVTSWYKKGEISASEYDAATLSLGITYAQARGEAMGWFQSLVKVEEKTKTNTQKAAEFREALQYLYNLWGGVGWNTGFVDAGIDDHLGAKVKHAVADGFAEGITDGLLGTLMGQDFEAAWSGVWESLWRQSAEQMDTFFKTTMETGDWKKGLESAGLWKDGKFDKWGAVGAAGGLVLGYGVQKQNRWMSAAGGAMSGAAMGASAGPWGAVIGAVIGAVAGYIMGGAGSGGRKDYSVVMGYNGVPTVGMEDVSGPERQELARQFLDKYKSYRAGFGDVMDLLGGGGGADFRGFTFATRGSSRDLNSMWKQIVSGELPRAMLSYITPQITAGLQGLGIGSGRIGTELQSLQEGSFDTAFAKFKAWLGSIVALDEAMETMGGGLDSLRAKVNETTRESFLGGFSDFMERARELTTSVDGLFSDEQVANAQELMELGAQQWQSTLQYLGQLESWIQGVQQGAEETRFGWAETRAREGGNENLGAFWQAELERLQGVIGGAQTGETISEAWQKFQQIADQLWNLNLGDNDAANFAFRQWVEQFFNQTEALATSGLTGFEEEAAQLAEEQRQQYELMRDALAGATTNAGSMSESMLDTTDGLDELTDTTLDANEQLGAFSESLASARDTAASFADLVSRLGGSILITLDLDPSLLAQQQSGQTDLVRIIRRGGTW